MNIQETPVHAWKLPAFVLLYIIVSYLADAWGHTSINGNTSEWLHRAWYYYLHMWFSTYKWLSIPVWLLLHWGLLRMCQQYYLSGLPRWGWGLALFGMLCSVTGGYCVNMLYLLIESMLKSLH